jgi:hypothetical protein
MLTDAAPAVVRQAAVSLRTEAAILDEQVLYSYLATSHPHHVRIAAWRLLRYRDAWTRVIVDLHLVNDSDNRVRLSARADLGNWLVTDAATTYTKPTATQRGRLLALIADSEPTLGTEYTRSLQFHVNAT